MGDHENYEKLLEKQVNRIQTVAGEQYSTQSATTAYQVQQETPEYTESFLTAQDASQRSFYEEYKNNWKMDYAGAEINDSRYVDPVDVQIQQENLAFFQKKELRKISKNQIRVFDLTMKELGAGGLGLKVGKQGAETERLLCANVRLAAIEKKKEEIIEEALIKVDKKMLPMIGDYLPFIRNLGPELVAEPTDDVGDDVTITEKSIKEFTSYVNRVFKNPAGVINESINDAIHSYAKIPTKLLEKDVIPGRFDAVKQIRDKYKAVHDIMRSSSNNPSIKQVVADIKKDKLLKDNVTFATEMYRRLDADLCYAMKEQGVSFTSETFLDRTDEQEGIYKTKGDLALKTILEQKNKVKDQDKEDSVDNYWREQMSSTLLRMRLDKKPKKSNEEGAPGEENKEQEQVRQRSVNKAAAKLNDGTDIIATADKIAEDFDTIDDTKRALFEELKDNVKGIASAISDINHEMEIARYIEGHMDKAEGLMRTELLRRIPWFVVNRQQQLLNLMNRVAGYLNAMKYLTGKTRLDVNGAQVIKSEIQRQKKKQEQDKENQENFGFVTSESAVVDVNSTGPGKDIVTLNRSPLTFEQFKKKVKEDMAGNGPSYNGLMKLLDEKNASLQYDFLILEGKDLLNMKVYDLETAFQDVKHTTQRLDVLVSAVKNYMDETDILYTRLKDGGIYSLSDEEKNDVVDRCAELRKKLYAINRVRNKNSGMDGAGKRYNNLLIAKLSKDKSYKYKSEDLTKMKYKVIFDQLEQYRCQAIADHVRTGTANDDMYTEDEKAEIAARLKKNNVVDDKTRDGRSKEFIIMEYFVLKNQEAVTLGLRHQDEIDRYLLQNKGARTIEDKKKAMIDKAIELENRQAKEKFEKKKAEIKAEKERRQREKEENERKLKEQQEKEKEAAKKEADKEESEDSELFTKAHKLKDKFFTPVSAIRENFPYSDKNLEDPASDSWAHAFASLINDMVGRYVVDGKTILEDESMSDKDVFGPLRNKAADPAQCLEILGKYVPNTAIAKTTFDNLEFTDKRSFLSFVKKALDTNKAPVMLKRKGAFITVYGIDKNNQLLCKRTSEEDSSQLYTENPDEVFDNMDQNGDVTLYWLQKVDQDGKAEPIEDEKQQISYSIPEEIIAEKEAQKKIKALKEIKVENKAPAPLKVKKKVKVEDPKGHTPYENQESTLYCWACAMNGMINHMAGKKISDLAGIFNYQMEVPKQEETRIANNKDYNAAVKELEDMQMGNKVGNPMIFGDYIFDKLPGTVVRSSQINHVTGKTELCKRRFKEELSQALENGPVGLLRNGHFILVYELDGDVIKAKNSQNDDPDDIAPDRYTVDKLYDFKDCDGNIEIVWLENIEGREKELTKDFDDLTFDEKTRQFKKDKQDIELRKASGAQDMLHKKGIEANDRKTHDVVNRSVYVPIRM